MCTLKNHAVNYRPTVDVDYHSVQDLLRPEESRKAQGGNGGWALTVSRRRLDGEEDAVDSWQRLEQRRTCEVQGDDWVLENKRCLRGT